jgi:hypothetical protein
VVSLWFGQAGPRVAGPQPDPRSPTPRVGASDIGARGWMFLPLWAARPAVKQVNDPLQLGTGIGRTAVEHRRETVIERRT